MERKEKEREGKFALLFSRAIRDYIVTPESHNPSQSNDRKTKRKTPDNPNPLDENRISAEADYAVAKEESRLGFLAEGFDLRVQARDQKKW